jgi:hypothetical protein
MLAAAKKLRNERMTWSFLVESSLLKSGNAEAGRKYRAISEHPEMATQVAR